MKKILTVMLLVLIPGMIMAQSYESLWKQVDEAGDKDLPRTQISLLEKIANKADKEKNYGQLMAARLMAAGVKTAISPDSADVERSRLEAKAKEAETSDPVMAAICNTILGRIYAQTQSRDDGTPDTSREYFKKAMSRPDILARQKASAYTPLISKGADSDIFGDDLLHVIGMEAGDYETLYTYYKNAGNRKAACISASMMKNTIAGTDSLIDIYGDLPEAGELAIKRYDMMKDGFSTEDKVAYIDYAVGRWKAWEPVKTLLNERKRLTNPMFRAELKYRVNIPNRECKVSLSDIRNVKEISMRVSLLDADGNTTAVKEKDRDKLAKIISKRNVCVQTRTYTGKKEYECMSDSMTIARLPVGVYLVEFYADNEKVEDAPCLYHVTDLYLMAEGLPGNKTRCVVVNATSGQPVAGATLRCEGNGKDKSVYEYTTDGNGEVVISNDASGYSYDKYVYTKTDKACPVMSLWTYYGYGRDAAARNVVNVYTDRSLYRPGQNIHAAVVVYHREGSLSTTAVANSEVSIRLRNANYETVEEKIVTTDSYGTASADFTIPQGQLTGMYSVEAVCGQRGSAYIHVEEYKRPTFRIEFPDYEERYVAGDTVKVKAYAKTYAGMPVQGAKVEYFVTRRRALWCWWYGGDSNDKELLKGTAVTGDDGSFEMDMPMTMPAKDEYGDAVGLRQGVFFNFTTEAKVTDTAGETHSGTFSLPLGTKPTSLSCDLGDKILVDSLKNITFKYTNAAGKAIDGTVSFTLGGKKFENIKANEPVLVSKLKPGKHHLFAVCGNDTIEQDVVIFSLKDKKPVVETDDWFYVSANEFPVDGSPIRLQVGSSAPEQHIVYNVFTGNTILESGVIDQSNALHNRLFKYEEKYGDGITVTYSWVKEGHMYSHSATIKKPLPDKRLLVEWKTFRDRLVPGQEEEWTLQVKHPEGKAADALIMVSMYDKSLDQIYKHDWNVGLGLYRNTPSTEWRDAGFFPLYAGYYADINYLTVRDLSLDKFNDKYLAAFRWYVSPYNANRYNTAGVRVRGTRATRLGSMAMKKDERAHVELSAAEDAILEENVVVKHDAMAEGNGTVDGENEEANGSADMSDVVVRENLDETAFFYPSLTTDTDGNVNISFRLPESVTTWRVLGYAHDKDMNYGLVKNDVVASKTVMVQPNMPRFVRTGDKAAITARLFNSSENPVTGKVKLELIEQETDRTFYSEITDYTVNANGTSSISFCLDMPSIMKSMSRDTQGFGHTSPSSSLLICRVTAEGDGYNDGEQHYLPVLPDMEMVTNTVPFTQNGPGKKEIDLGKLLPASRTDEGMLVVEYTNNPAWLMLQALPYVGNADEENAISLAGAFYANSLASNMMNSSPKIRQTFNAWLSEKGEETSLMSNLQKDSNLKELVLEETPWIMDAANEAEQKRNLAQFFNENNIGNRISSTLNGLKKLQNADGSWSWWRGMAGSPWMTVIVCKTLVRLNHLIGVRQETEDMLRNGIKYLSNETSKEVDELKKAEKKGKKGLYPSEYAINYLYIRSLDDSKPTGRDAQDIDYLVKLLSKGTSKLTIYGKANAAVILYKNGYETKARTFLQSLKEYSVCTEDAGRYFDTGKAAYSWFDYRIPTEVAAIEALRFVTPQDTKTVEEMQRWLLHEKRTQAWDTPVNSVDAVYAFFCGQGEGDIFGDKLAVKEQTTLKINDKVMETPKATAGIGYVKMAVPVAGAETFMAEKTSDGQSWGAVYAQFMQPITDIDDAASGIKIRREVLPMSGNKTARVLDKEGNGMTTLKVGDKVKVVITVEADRDYDFVQITDKRAACLEPASQLSGYRNGYYCAPKDHVTNFYIDRMPKGKHVIETEYYVERAGEYGSGTCTAQCAYAPEYSGRAKAEKIAVE